MTAELRDGMPVILEPDDWLVPEIAHVRYQPRCGGPQPRDDLPCVIQPNYVREAGSDGMVEHNLIRPGLRVAASARGSGWLDQGLIVIVFGYLLRTFAAQHTPPSMLSNSLYFCSATTRWL